jgi:NADH:ubiquinone oxidoreductase subunit 5 (subunit L)/multisubunit Na+/H+ antiporter MnhA subunit
MVITHAGAFAIAGWQANHAWWYWALFALPMLSAGVTSFALMRAWMLIFWGKPRTMTEAAVSDARPILWVPLAALAGLSIVGGSRLLEIKPLLAQAVTETEDYSFSQQESGSRPTVGFLQAWPVDLDPHGTPDTDEIRAADPVRNQLDISARLFRTYLPWSLGIGLGLGFLIYLRGLAIPTMLLKLPPLRWIHSLLRRRLGWDDACSGFGSALAEATRRIRIDAEKWGAGSAAERLAEFLRRTSRWLSSSGR